MSARGRAARLGLVLSMLTILMTALAVPASAHATLDYTDPPDGMRYAVAPARVLVAFTEPVSVSSGFLHVVDSTGARVDDGAPAHPPGHGEQLTVSLRAGLDPDVYVMSWRVVSVDSHVVAGSARFAVGDVPFTAAGAAPNGTADGGDGLVERASTAARALMFSGIVLLGGLWALWLAPIGEPALRRARRVGAAGWAAAVAGLTAGLLLQGAATSGRGAASVWRVDQLRDTVSTRFGQLSLWALGGLLVVGALLPRVLRAAGERRVHGAAEAAGVILLGSAVALSATGHAASAGNASDTGRLAVALAANAAHLVAAIVWIGGVATLGLVLLPGAAARDSRDAATRFLPFAATSVAVLALTGVFQGWRESASAAALFGTTYGRLVLLKAVLLVLLLAVAAVVRGRWELRSRWAVRGGWAARTEAPLPSAVGSPPSQAPAEVATEAAGATADEWGADGGPTRVWRPVSAGQALRRWIAVELGIGAATLIVAATLVGQTPAKAAYAQQQSERPVTSSAQLSDGRSAPADHQPGPPWRGVRARGAGRAARGVGTGLIGCRDDRDAAGHAVRRGHDGPGRHPVDGARRRRDDVRRRCCAAARRRDLGAGSAGLGRGVRRGERPFPRPVGLTVRATGGPATRTAWIHPLTSCTQFETTTGHHRDSRSAAAWIGS